MGHKEIIQQYINKIRGAAKPAQIGQNPTYPMEFENEDTWRALNARRRADGLPGVNHPPTESPSHSGATYYDPMEGGVPPLSEAEANILKYGLAMPPDPYGTAANNRRHIEQGLREGRPVVGQPSMLAQALTTPRDELMNTAFGRGIERTVRGGASMARPISMEDDRRKAALIALRAANETLRPQADPSTLNDRATAALQRLAQRKGAEYVPGGLPLEDREPGEQPPAWVGSGGTPIDESKAGPARELREHIAKYRAMQRLNTPSRRFQPRHVLQDAAFMQYVAMNPKLAPALLDFRAKQGALQNDAVKGQLAHMLGMTQAENTRHQSDIYGRVGMGQNEAGVRRAELESAGLPEERAARARALGRDPNDEYVSKFLIGAGTADENRMTPEEAQQWVERIRSGGRGALPPSSGTAGAPPPLKPGVTPTQAINRAWDIINATRPDAEGTKKILRENGVTETMLREYAANSPWMAFDLAAFDPARGVRRSTHRSRAKWINKNY